jgi:hypothetical protein
MRKSTPSTTSLRSSATVGSCRHSHSSRVSVRLARSHGRPTTRGRRPRAIPVPKPRLCKIFQLGVRPTSAARLLPEEGGRAPIEATDSASVQALCKDGSDGTRTRALPPRSGSERGPREPSVCQTFDRRRSRVTLDCHWSQRAARSDHSKSTVRIPSQDASASISACTDLVVARVKRTSS